MIRSFKCKKTESLFGGKCDRAFKSFRNTAERKLAMLEEAVLLSDLKSPPGNQLEALKKDRVGQHSIRINDQWRVCFVWTEQGPEQVEIVDYH